MTGPIKTQWLEQYQTIQELHASILDMLNTLEQQDDDLSQLNELISERDRMIKELPFAALSETEVSQLSSEIEQLQYNHQLLTKTVTEKKQALLDQSSKHQKTNRNIKAYQQAQNY